MGKSGPLSQWVKVGQFCPQCLSGPLLPNDCLKDQRSQVPSLYCQSLRVSVSQFRRGDRPPGLCVYVALFYLPTGSKINGLKSHHYSLRVSVYQFRRGDWPPGVWVSVAHFYLPTVSKIKFKSAVQVQVKFKSAVQVQVSSKHRNRHLTRLSLTQRWPNAPKVERPTFTHPF